MFVPWTLEFVIVDLKVGFLVKMFSSQEISRIPNVGPKTTTFAFEYVFEYDIISGLEINTT